MNDRPIRVKLINPNTTQAMTEVMVACARRFVGPQTTLVGVSPEMGPPSIEGYYDEALATPGLLHEIKKGEADGFQGYVIACFGDPGVFAAREIARGPVIGIAEAAMHLASLLAPSFSVVTTLQRTCGMSWHIAERSGLKRYCRSIRAVEIPVLDLENPDARRRITEECRRALSEDEAEAIVLGCAGMVDLCEEISQQIQAPVVEGVCAAVKLVETLITLGLATSKRGEFAHPLAKKYLGLLSAFSPT